MTNNLKDYATNTLYASKFKHLTISWQSQIKRFKKSHS